MAQEQTLEEHPHSFYLNESETGQWDLTADGYLSSYLSMLRDSLEYLAVLS